MATRWIKPAIAEMTYKKKLNARLNKMITMRLMGTLSKLGLEDEGDDPRFDNYGAIKHISGRVFRSKRKKVLIMMYERDWHDNTSLLIEITDRELEDRINLTIDHTKNEQLETFYDLIKNMDHLSIPKIVKLIKNGSCDKLGINGSPVKVG